MSIPIAQFLPLHSSLFLKQNLIYLNWRLITLQYYSGFCHTLIWIRHGRACVPHPEPPSHLHPHPITQSHPSAPALSTLFYASNLDCRSVSHMTIYIFHCYSLKSSHPCLLPQGPKDSSIHLCLFCCLAYRAPLPSWCPLKSWNAWQTCTSPLSRGHANLLYVIPILVYVLPKWATFETKYR